MTAAENAESSAADSAASHARPAAHQAMQSLSDGSRRCEAPQLPDLSLLPPFRCHRLIRGGHLQTVLSLRGPDHRFARTQLHWVDLADGDQLALHDDCPPTWRAGGAALMLVHGLCGCRDSPYMLRLAELFLRLHWRVFRLEMRGCGAGRDRSLGLTHAGRGDDCLAALQRVAALTQSGPLAAVGVSLGGNQLLRAAGAVGAGETPRPDWLDRWQRLVAVSPPVDLVRCSDHMQRPLLRPYNRYFIANLMRRLPKPIRSSPERLRHFQRPWPKTLRELDDRITAPLSGFDGALDYYRQASADALVPSIRLPTLLLTARDDPIVPIDSFAPLAASLGLDTPAAQLGGRLPIGVPLGTHPFVRLLVTAGGGHAGFIARGAEPFYMDQVIQRWCGTPLVI